MVDSAAVRSLPKTVRARLRKEGKIPQADSRGGGGITQQIVSAPTKGIAQPTIPRQLRVTAIRVVGSISRIERRNGQITFVGVRGRRFTPSSERLRRTGAISEREFQARAGTGSKAAIRREIQARQISATKQIMLLSESGRRQLNIRQKSISIPLKASPKKIKREVLIATKTPIKTKKISQLKKLERDIRDIRELEKQAARRSQRAADIFKAIPGLRGDNFAQQTARALLALPARATIGLGEQVLISGLKLGITAKAVGLARKGVIDIKPIQEETGRALKQVPITIAKGYDPRTPEGLANIIATVALFRFSRGRGKVSTKATKTASKSVARKALGLSKKQSGFKKAFNRQVAKDLSKLSKSPSFIRKTAIKANAIRRAIPRAIKGKVKAVIAKRGTRFNTAREILRKQQANVKAIKIRRQQFKTTKIELRKAKVSPLRKRQLLGAIKSKIRSLQKTNKGFDTRLNKLGFRKSVRGKLRKSLRPEKAPKIKKIKIPKGKRIIKIRLKARPRAALRKVTAPIRKVRGAIGKVLSKTLQKGKKLTFTARRIVNNSVNKIIRNVNKVSNAARIKLEITVKAFNRIKNPTIKQVKLFARRINRIISKARKVGVRKVRKGVRLVKRPIKGAIRKGERLDVALRRKVDRSINRINRVTRKAGIKIRVVEKITAKTGRRLLIAEKSVARILRRIKGKITKKARASIRSIEKKLPIKVKIVKTIPRRIKGLPRKRTGGRSPVRRAARKLSKADQIRFEARQILRGKKKLTIKTNPKVRKLVRKGRILAQKKAQIGIRQSAARKVRGISAKLERARVVTKKFNQAFKRKRALREFNIRKSKKFVGKLRIERDTGIAARQARLLQQRINQATTKIKKASNTQNRIQKVVRESGDRQVLQQVIKQRKKLPPKTLNKFKKKANNIGKAKTKGAAKKAFTQVKRDMFGLGQKLIQVAKNKPAVVKAILKAQLGVLAGLGVLANAALAKSRFTPKRQAGIVIPAKKQTPKQIQEQKKASKPIEEPEERQIVIQDGRIDTLSKVKQLAIIASILAAVAGTQFIRRGSQILKPPIAFFQGSLASRRRFLFNRIRNKRFVFIPDLYSIIFGIRAKPKERIALLKVGRVFTGTEIRKIV